MGQKVLKAANKIHRVKIMSNAENVYGTFGANWVFWPAGTRYSPLILVKVVSNAILFSFTSCLFCFTVMGDQTQSPPHLNLVLKTCCSFRRWFYFLPIGSEFIDLSSEKLCQVINSAKAGSLALSWWTENSSMIVKSLSG